MLKRLGQPSFHTKEKRCYLHRCIVQAARSNPGGLGDEIDMAVFRFTLGIPGFNDSLIPRVVGVLAAALLVLNHFLDNASPSDAQVNASL